MDLTGFGIDFAVLRNILTVSYVIFNDRDRKQRKKFSVYLSD